MRRDLLAKGAWDDVKHQVPSVKLWSHLKFLIHTGGFQQLGVLVG